MAVVAIVVVTALVSRTHNHDEHAILHSRVCNLVSALACPLLRNVCDLLQSLAVCLAIVLAAHTSTMLHNDEHSSN